ncbi:efflux RND transporter periplasmic adaptor subunit [Sulfuriroseicoccus oceanibius]|uniref:Efflux RND transporter periplasmic adaptor subunit n=1 Tax=Sulfuriroseicoccus oceanibius TaxID=2707525 RepID=A0A6B3L7U0_9BACT|nr:efflux RND transporter periplasmic adaptor subunit [Sulfuriroseicoccus oceanibius]QQL45332.1 efflux RND transporter periplasmic adaptor subunit [Sulfuriroseicoccus oceanibius]
MTRQHIIVSLAAVAAVFTICGCGGKNEYAPPPTAPPVTVTTPEIRDEVVYRTFPATTAGVAEVDIRARVRGVLEERTFQEGAVVKEGERLFLIEQDQYEAAVQAATADVSRAKAALDLAKTNLGRLQRAGARAVSELDIETAQAQVAEAQAVLNQAEAKLDTAKLDLSYTDIKAPVSGRMSRALVDIGNLVGNNEATLLTTIINDEEIRVFFEVPERQMLEFYRYRANKAAEGINNKDVIEKVRLELADGTIYGELGEIDFIDNRVDESSRTASIRAIFPNPEYKLASGLFATIGYPEKIKDAVLIPALAVMQDLEGDFVWVVDESDTVRLRRVETGAVVTVKSDDPNVPNRREVIIQKGLGKDDRVIVAGLQRARDGSQVTPTMAENNAVKPEQPAELKLQKEQATQQ